MSRRVAVIDDDDDSRAALEIALIEHGRTAVSFASAREALAAKKLPHIVLIDMQLPGESAGDAITRLLRRNPRALPIAITSHRRDDYVFEALRAGAVGYVLKLELLETLGGVLETVEAGGSPISPSIARRVLKVFREETTTHERLTTREREILERFAKGDGYEETARELGIAIDTVRTHVRRMYAKLRVRNRAEAVLTAIRRGILG